MKLIVYQEAEPINEVVFEKEAEQFEILVDQYNNGETKIRVWVWK